MSVKQMTQLGGIALILVAVLLTVLTGSVARALGAAPGGGMPFWFQLSFMRMFAAALAGLGAILLWAASRLSFDQLRSLMGMVTFILGGLGLVATTQQIAIWSSSLGWALAGLFMFLAIACGMSSSVVRTARI